MPEPKHSRSRWLAYVLVILAAIQTASSYAADWPTHQHDNRRGGVTAERLTPPLHEQWRHVARHAPQPAWPEPAGADLWHNMPKLNPLVIYDRAYHVVAVGDAVYFGSSANDTVTCLDAKTGRERWRVFTGGPVRLAPAVAAGKVYVGSDDGFVYCLRSTDGGLVWRRRAGRSDRRLPGNERMISLWPVRGGLLVQDGVVYVCSGLFPTEGVFLSALKADDGSVVWQTDAGLSGQGYLLASTSRLYVPTGRTSPIVFDLRSGKRLGQLKAWRGEGGAYALLVGETIIHGPGADSLLAVTKPTESDRIASFPGVRLIATPGLSYLQSLTQIVGFDRASYLEERRQREALAIQREKLTKAIGKLGRYAGGREGRELRVELNDIIKKIQEKAKEKSDPFEWTQPCKQPYALILSGDVLYAGGQDEVAAYRATDGKPLWTGKVDGRAYGLAVSNGRLLVSTSTGAIHCFGSSSVASPAVVKAQGASDPYPDDDLTPVYAAAAERIIALAGIEKGYCLVLGCGEGRLAHQIAKRTALTVVGVEPDAVKVAAARRALDRAGLYGRRVIVHTGSLTSLPYGDYVANLVVSDQVAAGRALPTSAPEIRRVLRPGGGIAVIGCPADSGDGAASVDALAKDRSGGWRIVEQGGRWAVCRRGPLEGIGEWTHFYADPANTACSNDRRVGGRMQLQWFGRPGPRGMIDRHHRNMPPLVRDGRAFIPGDDRIVTIDAYNGTMLWELAVPGARRLGAPFDAGNMVAGPDRVYLAVADKCLGLDPATGRRVSEFVVPQPVGGEPRHWGYVGLVGEALYGSSRKPRATYTEVSHGADAYQWGDYKRMVTSDALFCMDRRDGRIRWRHPSSVIINPTIAVGGGRVYFVRSDSPKSAQDEDGQINLTVLLGSGGTVVALDAKTGKVVWEQRRDLEMFRHIIYLCYADEVLLAFGTGTKGRQLWHELIAFDAATGSARWKRSRSTGWRRGGTHGEQERHPVILGKTIYAEARAYDLKTGQPVRNWKFDHNRSGCGTVTGSASCLFFRDGNPTMLDLGSGKRASLSQVNRPGCWVNIIPASGLVVVPEGSSGCSCGYPIQTSMAFAPRAPVEQGSGKP